LTADLDLLHTMEAQLMASIQALVAEAAQQAREQAQAEQQSNGDGSAPAGDTAARFHAQNRGSG
jgi:hypothetical protein